MCVAKCPSCNGSRVWKDGVRHTLYSDVQRWLCRNCGLRFSQANSNRSNTPERVPKVPSSLLNSLATIPSNRRILRLEAKNLAIRGTRQKKAQREGTQQTADIKGKLVEFAWWMEKQAYAKETIRGYGSCLRALLQRNANLLDPESVKEALAKEKKWSQNRRSNVINAYTLFLKLNNIQWEKPKCKITRKIPFIPTEQEIDSLIAGCGKKTSTFLQLLKETAMRSGEAKRILWTDIDSERRLITLNNPEKGGNPRIWKVSPKLIAMLNALTKKSLRTFGDGPINSTKSTFLKARKRLATKLQNPRLTKISFHTFRHWKATMEYHKTKDPYHVKQFLGHKSLQSTDIYINVEQAIFDEEDNNYHVKVAQEPKQVEALLAVGFEYVCEKDGLLFFRKRK